MKYTFYTLVCWLVNIYISPPEQLGGLALLAQLHIEQRYIFSTLSISLQCMYKIYNIIQFRLQKQCTHVCTVSRKLLNLYTIVIVFGLSRMDRIK